MLICSVYDSKAEAFLRPFMVPTKGVAIRSFSAAVNEERHDFHRHSGDYTLFVIGTFCEETGKVVGASAYENLGVATQFLDNDGARNAELYEENV